MSQPTCKNGHERTPENTYRVQGKYGMCQICRVCKREWRQAQAALDKNTRVLPIEPLAAALAQRAEEHPAALKSMLGASLARSYLRAVAAGGLGTVLADRVCVKGLHVHPSLVYGRRWEQA